MYRFFYINVLQNRIKRGTIYQYSWSFASAASRAKSKFCHGNCAAVAAVCSVTNSEIIILKCVIWTSAGWPIDDLT